MTTTEKNRYVAERLGAVYYNPCGAAGCNAEYPDFSTDAGKVQLLRFLRESEYWESFQFWLYNQVLEKHDGYDPVKYFIIDYLTDTTGKLLDAAYQWFK